MKIQFSPIGWTQKPEPYIKDLNVNLVLNERDLTFKQFVSIIARGHSFIPSLLKIPEGKEIKRLKEYVNTTQIFALDFDNAIHKFDEDGKKITGEFERNSENYITPQDFLLKCKTYGIEPSIIYTTFSSKNEWIK